MKKWLKTVCFVLLFARISAQSDSSLVFTDSFKKDSIGFASFLRTNGVNKEQIKEFLKYRTAYPRKNQFLLNEINQLTYDKAVFTWFRKSKVLMDDDSNLAIFFVLMAEEYYALYTLKLDYERVKKVSSIALPNFLNAIANDTVIHSLQVHWMQANGGMGIETPLKERNYYGRIRFQGDPTPAEVNIDGKFINYSDNEFILAEGKHTFELKKQGFGNQIVEEFIHGGKRKSIAYSLKRN